MHTPGVNSFRVVLNILSLLVLFFGLLLFVPAAFLLIGPDEAAIDFMLSGVITLVMGSVAFLLTRVKSRDLRARDGFLLVAITWLVLAAVASLPLYLHLPISYTHAFFEAISGLTTTGATSWRPMGEHSGTPCHRPANICCHHRLNLLAIH